MAKQYLSGGGNPFGVTPAPSVFNPNPPDDLISRQGEPAIWIRAIPKIGEFDETKMAIPGSDSQLYRIERYRRMPTETLNPMFYDGNVVQTKYGPISKIRSLKVFRNDDFGGNFNLSIESFEHNRIKLKPNIEFQEYYQLDCDYDIESFTKFENVKFIQEEDGFLLHPVKEDIIVLVHSVWRERLDKSGYDEIGFKYDFTKISCETVAEAGRRYLLSYVTFSPIKIGYKTIDTKDARLAEKMLDVQSGDIDIVVGSGLNLSKDDILIPLRTLRTEKEILQKDKEGRYPVKYSPLREIVAVYTDSVEYEDFWIEDSRYVRINSSTLPERIICVYQYNPRYSIMPDTTASALAERIQPRKFIGRINQTRLDLGRIFRESIYRSVATD